ncbi:MAG TPA: S-methyl-5-thioribose-1-phosphate isomerase [Actinobacteria bacterium]|nr:S-methyl-5-thioribose-1-phosphate isomerase [Actinomycetota bacterium]
MIKTIEWKNGKIRMIDQSKLPLKEEFFECSDYECVVDAIKSMKIRGAPAIGVAAAMGIALGAKNSSASNVDGLLGELEVICKELSKARPTAVNLFWAIERMKKIICLSKWSRTDDLKRDLEDEAIKIAEEDVEASKKMGRIGASLLKNGDNVLTHCNAGSLATVAYGTALAPIYHSLKEGKKIHVYVDETRPKLQGARLTIWELNKENVPTTLITDNMAGYLMSQGKIDKVFVGADRIATNGDVVNKIGTYSLAVLAKEHNIPFYVVAPISTIDFNVLSGNEIPIEERDGGEVTHIGGVQITSNGVSVVNPAFDVTPNLLITAIVTEKGILYPSLKEKINNLRS